MDVCYIWLRNRHALAYLLLILAVAGGCYSTKGFLPQHAINYPKSELALIRYPKGALEAMIDGKPVRPHGGDRQVDVFVLPGTHEIKYTTVFPSTRKPLTDADMFHASQLHRTGSVWDPMGRKHIKYRMVPEWKEHSVHHINTKARFKYLIKPRTGQVMEYTGGPRIFISRKEDEYKIYDSE